MSMNDQLIPEVAGLSGKARKFLEDLITEYVNTFSGIASMENSAVAVFGTSRARPRVMRMAWKLGAGLATLRIRVAQGGGRANSVMRAVAQGTASKEGHSVTCCLQTPSENGGPRHEVTDQVHDHALLEVRTLALIKIAAVFVLMGMGGFGTLAELYGVLTKIQTDKMDADGYCPLIIAVGRWWWLLRAYHWYLVMSGTINPSEARLITYVKTVDRALALIDRHWLDNNLPRVSRENCVKSGPITLKPPGSNPQDGVAGIPYRWKGRANPL